jgi:hypothetical protein
LRIVPYAGHKGYQCYLDGWKVNGKRKRLYFKDEAAATKKLAELAKQQKKEGQAGLDVPLELRVMAVKAAKRLAPFNNSVLDAQNGSKYFRSAELSGSVIGARFASIRPG